MSTQHAVHRMLSTQIRNAGMKAQQIEAVAKHLADLMLEAHGGKWKVRVNHDHCFVIVSREFSEGDRND